MQSRLAANPFWRAHNQRPHVIPVIEYTLEQTGKFADTAAGTGLYNYIVLNLNWATVESSFNPNQQVVLDPASAALRRQLSDSLAAIGRTLRETHIGFLVVTHPGPFEIDPTEAMWFSFAYVPQKNDYIRTDEAPNPDPQVGELLNGAAREAGVRLVNLWPQLIADEKVGVRVPLFGSGDYHFTQYARKLVGDAVAQRLEETAPWQH